MDHPIENKVAKSGLVTLDLEEMRPAWKTVGFDIAPFLREGLMLVEKEFRSKVNETDWSQYSGLHVFIYCSSEAIVPTWAYMLLSSALDGNCEGSIIGSEPDLQRMLWSTFVEELEVAEYVDQRIIIKGCSDESIPETVYHQLSSKLIPVVKSLMFGEPCSTVPVFKRK